MNPNINDLPVELLVDILRRLDQNHLKNAILTCKRWKVIIENHCSWSIEWNRRDIIHRAVEPLLNTNRKFDKLKFINYDSHRCVNDALFLELLKCFPDLEDIHVSYVVVNRMPADYDLPELKKLKTLRTFACSVNIFKCLRTSSLKYLHINPSYSFTTNSLQFVADFVRRQKKLTELHLNVFPDVYYQHLCHDTPYGTIPFKLHHLSVHAFRERHHSIIGLCNFIKSHSRTLQKLNLSGAISTPICELIFNELQNLRFLELWCLLEEIEIENSMKINANIEQLQLRFYNISLIALSRLCKSVPNVKMLTFRFWVNSSAEDAERLHIISTTLSNITTLYVNRVDGSFNEIKFPNLISFHIQNLKTNEVNWDAFTKNNCRIREIVIVRVYIGCLNLDSIETITRNLKLQILKLGEGFSADERFLSIIRNNCLNLKVLDLHKSCGIKDLVRNDGRAVRLRLCDEIYFPSSVMFTFH